MIEIAETKFSTTIQRPKDNTHLNNKKDKHIHVIFKYKLLTSSIASARHHIILVK